MQISDIHTMNMLTSMAENLKIIARVVASLEGKNPKFVVPVGSTPSVLPPSPVLGSKWIVNNGTAPECEYVFYLMDTDDAVRRDATDRLVWTPKYGITHYMPNPYPTPQKKSKQEWIPNTGTKPECDWVCCRLKGGAISTDKVTNLDWESNQVWSITHYIPIPAPPEFKEKSRFKVIRIPTSNEGGEWVVKDTAMVRVGKKWIASGITSKEEADNIAKLYESMYKKDQQ